MMSDKWRLILSATLVVIASAVAVGGSCYYNRLENDPVKPSVPIEKEL